MKKNKGYTRQYKNDDPTTALSHIDQQKAMLLDTIDMQMEHNKKEISQIQKKINFFEPEINKDLDRIADSRLRYEALRNKSKAPEKIEKNLGLAGILQVSKSKE